MFDEIGENVFRRRFDSLDLNVCVVAGDDGLLIVDTRESHRRATELIEELRAFSPVPVRWVVNTHWHWDHTFGNAMFGDAEIWGHVLCADALIHRGAQMKQDVAAWFGANKRSELDEVEVLAPSKTFSDRASLDIGRGVDMSYHGLGHTDADIVVRVPDADVAFFGDLVEEGAPPFFGDSHPIDWPSTLGLAVDERPGVVVPGHGDVVDEAFVRTQIGELIEVADRATAYVNHEIELDVGIDGGPYPPVVMKTALQRARAIS